MSQRIQYRRGTAAAWTTANPVLAAGEPGFETDTGKVKFGDGATAWASLAYFGGGGSASATSYAGSTNLSATNVEAALDELDTEKAALTHIGVAGVVASAYHTAGASVANNTTMVVSLGAEETDPYGFHDNVTNNTRMTVPAGLGGTYLAVLNAAFAFNTTATRSVSIYKNGAALIGQGWNPAISSSGQFVNPMPLVAGDYVELAAYQNSGGALTLTNTQTKLTLIRLAD